MGGDFSVISINPAGIADYRVSEFMFTPSMRINKADAYFAKDISGKQTKKGVISMAVRNPVDLIALILVIIGGLNWGLVGLLDFNLVDAIFGAGSTLSRIIYILVGLAALYMIYFTVRADTYQTHEAAVRH